MEIIVKKNKHLENIINNNKEYGCVCPNCGTVFIFNETDIIKPRVIDLKKRDCVITCPNKTCRTALALDSKFIIEFTKEFSKQDFKKKT